MISLPVRVSTRGLVQYLLLLGVVIAGLAISLMYFDTDYAAELVDYNNLSSVSSIFFSNDSLSVPSTLNSGEEAKIKIVPKIKEDLLHKVRLSWQSVPPRHFGETVGPLTNDGKKDHESASTVVRVPKKFGFRGIFNKVRSLVGSVFSKVGNLLRQRRKREVVSSSTTAIIKNASAGAAKQPSRIAIVDAGKGTDRNEEDLSVVEAANDHIMYDERMQSIVRLGPRKRGMVNDVFDRVMKRNDSLSELAASSNYSLDKLLVYRYFISNDWNPLYYGIKVEEAVVNTLTWRRDFNFHRLNQETLVPLLAKGLVYTLPLPDKKNRTLIFLRLGRNMREESSGDYLKLMMYTVERAERQSVLDGAGEFVAVVDLTGFNVWTAPSLGSIQSIIDLLKLHYPYRLGRVVVINAGAAFHFIWRLVKPVLPKKVLGKVQMLTSREATAWFDSQLGLDRLEESLGGRLPNLDWNNGTFVTEYWSNGYWAKM